MVGHRHHFPARMQIRRAVAEECETLSALALRAKGHWGYTTAQLEIWRPILTISGEAVVAHPTFVAQVDAEIAGFYSLLRFGARWELDNLWVAPERVRQGVGRALLAHALETAAAGGAGELHIDADPHAEAFYRACGALRVGVVAAPIEGEPSRVRPQLVLSTRRETPLTQPERS
jgi:GNAT superfamily N-acetyltransferase